MSENLYELLGVQKSATEAELKKAWKRKALDLHPDKGGDKEVFQKVKNAYDILMDPQRRTIYDQTGQIPGEEGSGGGGFPGGFGFGGPGGVHVNFGGGGGMPDIFSNLFGGMGMGNPFFGGRPGGSGDPPKKPKGDNLLHEVGVNISDFYHGKTVTYPIHRDKLCHGCKGIGGARVETCQACGGRGMMMRQVQQGNMIQISHSPCGICQQQGKRVLDPCKICEGKKVLPEKKMVEIKIEPGMKEGDRIIMSEQCSESPNWERPGDLVILLRPSTEDPQEWIRVGDELRYKVDLTLAEAMLGWERELKGHPSGRSLHLVWTGGSLREGEILRVPGWGMPIRGGGGSLGDLRFICHIVGEQGAWSEEQRRALCSVWPDWKPPVVREDSIHITSS
jgi:DnaJ family protein A protein 2